MASNTRSSAGGGSRSSKRVVSPAGGAASRSSRASRGTSATTTSTGPSGGARSTEQKTVRQRRTAPNGDAGLVVDAVKRDLQAIAQADAALAKSGLAATALALAAHLDAPTGCSHFEGIAGVSPTAKSMCAGQLRDTLDRLRELMPKAAERDGLDDLSRRRATRLAGKPKASA